MTVGLARRSGDAAATAATWARVAPVVAGTDVELLLLDVWGELSVVAEQVSRPTATSWSTRCAPRCAAQARPGGAWPSTCGGSSSGPSSPATPPQPPTPRPGSPRSPHTTRGCAAGPRRPLRWAAVLAGRVCPETVDAAAARLADDGLRDEAAALCRAAAQRTSDPAATRRLLGAGRGLRPGPGGPRAAGLLSEREREVGALVLDGLTQKEIGARLYISPKTVEQHVARMRQKLAASNRATLVAALRTHL